MRHVTLGNPPAKTDKDTPTDEWVKQALTEIAKASREQHVVDILAGYSVTNATLTRTLDCDTATLDDLRNFVGTLVLDLKAGQVKRT